MSCSCGERWDRERDVKVGIYGTEQLYKDAGVRNTVRGIMCSLYSRDTHDRHVERVY